MKSVEPFFHANHHYSVEPGTACADCVKSMNWSHSVSLTLLSIQKSRQTAESHTKSKDSNLTTHKYTGNSPPRCRNTTSL